MSLTREQIEHWRTHFADIYDSPEVAALCDMALRSITVESAIREPNAGAWRWIDDAVKALKMVDAAPPEFVKLCDELLQGVPCPQEDLGFDSPADRAARAPVAQEAVAYQGVRMSIAGGINHYTIMPTVGQLVDCGYMESEIRALYAAPVSPVPEGPFIAVGTVRGNGELTMYEREIPDGVHIVYIARKGSPVPEDSPKSMVLVPRQWDSEMAHAGYQVHKHSDIQCAECGAIYTAMIENWEGRREP